MTVRHAADDRGTVGANRRGRRERGDRESRRRAVQVELGVGRVLGKLDEVLWRHAAQLRCERVGVAGADLKGDQRSAVAEDGGGRGIVELFEHLVRQRERAAILPPFRQERREGRGSEVLYLVHDEIEVRSFFLGLIGAAEGGDLDARHEQRTEERRRILAQAPLAQVHEQPLSPVRDAAKVEPRPRCIDNAAQERIRDESADLVLYGSNRLGLELRGHSGEFVFPKRTHDGIGEPFLYAASESRVGQQLEEGEERRVGQFQERQQRISKHVLHARAKKRWIQMAECRQHAVGHQRSLPWIVASERIERNDSVRVGRIEEHDVVRARWWRAAKHCLDQITMRLNDRTPLGYLPRDAGGEDKSGGTMRGSVVYCYLSAENEVLTWFGRDPDFERKHQLWLVGDKSDREPEKFHFVKGFHRGLELYGVHRLRDPQVVERLHTLDHLIVVEGPNDAITLDANGIPAVALCSNTITEEQVEQLAALVAEHKLRGVVLMLDNDQAGEKGVEQALPLVASRVPARLAWSGTMFGRRFKGRQPESLSHEEIAAVLGTSCCRSM